MKNPCIGCTKSWYAGRKCSCADMCELLEAFKEVNAMLKKVITEDEFDKLADQTQMYYLFCPKCKYFYLATDKHKHLCGEPGNISVEEMLKREG